MLKNILKLDGAQQLSKNEQKTINGGITQACAESMLGCRIKGTTACGGAYPTETTKPSCGTLKLCCGQLM